MLTHNHSLNWTQRFAPKVSTTHKECWVELASEENGFGKLKMQIEPAALEGKGQGV
jgi:hypothetical protein